MLKRFGPSPIRHLLVFSYESEKPCQGFGLSGTPESGYRERLVFPRPNRVFRNNRSGFRERSGGIANAKSGFQEQSIGFSGTIRGYRECLIGFSGTIPVSGAPHRVIRNVSGYRERLIGVSGTTFSGYREHLIGVSGTAVSTNPLTINTNLRVFERLTL
jgi:hypothetical protein